MPIKLIDKIELKGFIGVYFIHRVTVFKILIPVFTNNFLAL
jgi:hypothetical protein